MRLSPMGRALRTAALGALAILPIFGQEARGQDETAGVQEHLEACAACHGPNGASRDPQYPILAGQELYYLYVQLKDFASGLREDEIMSPIARELAKEDMQTIAKFYSEQTWPNTGFRPDPALVRKGELATAAGECVVCHLGTYTGNSRVPRLAGQHGDYLRKTMLDLKTDARNNAAAIAALMKSYSDDEIAAMAEFLAGL